MFGDWTTVLPPTIAESTVCCGPFRARISTTSTTSGSVRASARETARYVPRSWPRCRSSIRPEIRPQRRGRSDHPLESEIVTIPRQASLAAIARSTGIDDDLLRLLMRNFDRGSFPRMAMTCGCLPVKKTQVLAKLDDIPAYQARQAQGAAVVRHKSARAKRFRPFPKVRNRCEKHPAGE